MTVKYGEFTAVNGVSFELTRGAFGLLGRNGAGKTTILRTLLGLLKPHKGEVTVYGKNPIKNGAQVRALVGYMPESQAIFPGMTGFEAVAYSGEIAGLSRRVARRRAHEMLYFAGLGEARYRPVDGYSQGMRQKVKFAMALVHDPPLLFLDEPTNGLDPSGRKEMLGLINDLTGKRGKTLILSTHILGDVEEVCREVVLLHKGEIKAKGSINDLTGFAEKMREMVVIGKKEPIEQSLMKRGITIKSIKLEGNALKIRAGIPPELKGNEIFAAVKEAGGKVRAISILRRSLEEVFGDFVGED